MKKLIIIFVMLFSVMGYGQKVSKPAKVCKGITLKGLPCKSIMVDSTNYCRSHNPKAINCSGVNAKKKRCGNKVAKIGNFCKFHTNKSSKVKWEDDIRNSENDEFTVEVAFNLNIPFNEVTQAQFNERYLENEKSFDTKYNEKYPK